MRFQAAPDPWETWEQILMPFTIQFATLLLHMNETDPFCIGLSNFRMCALFQRFLGDVLRQKVNGSENWEVQ